MYIYMYMCTCTLYMCTRKEETQGQSMLHTVSCTCRISLYTASAVHVTNSKLNKNKHTQFVIVMHTIPLNLHLSHTILRYKAGVNPALNPRVSACITDVAGPTMTYFSCTCIYTSCWPILQCWGPRYPVYMFVLSGSPFFSSSMASSASMLYTCKYT